MSHYFLPKILVSLLLLLFLPVHVKAQLDTESATTSASPSAVIETPVATTPATIKPITVVSPLPTPESPKYIRQPLSSTPVRGSVLGITSASELQDYFKSPTFLTLMSLTFIVFGLSVLVILITSHRRSPAPATDQSVTTSPATQVSPPPASQASTADAPVHEIHVRY